MSLLNKTAAAILIAASISTTMKATDNNDFNYVVDRFADIEILRWIVIVVVMVTTLYSGIEYFVKNWGCLWSKP